MSKIYIIDLFCGAGGTTTAVHNSNSNMEVVACINHDKNAILSHKTNYPNCVHYIEDIRTIELSPIVGLINKFRKNDPNCKIAIWASLECTNFSIAKGGLPRDADSRSLADHIFRYLDAINPDYLWIENVKEFMSWGPMEQVYKNDTNSILWKAYAENTKKAQWFKIPYDGNEKIYTKLNVLPWLRPVSKLKGEYYLEWIDKVNTYGFEYDSRILCSADFGGRTIRKRYFGQFAVNSNLIAFPTPTHTKEPDQFDLFEDKKPWKPVRDVLDLGDEGESIFNRKKPYVDATLNRIIRGLEKFVTNSDSTSCLQTYYGNGGVFGLDAPAPTVTTKDRIGKVCFLAQGYSKGDNVRNIDIPAGAIVTNDKHNLVTVRTSPFLLNPQYKSKGGSIDKPCFTLIARMDKAPPYLITPVHKKSKLMVNSTYSSPTMLKLLALMEEKGIADIKMRLLNVKELLQIQGFPSDYKLKGTITEQKKYVGNSVEVMVGIALFKSIRMAYDKQINFMVA